MTDTPSYAKVKRPKCARDHALAILSTRPQTYFFQIAPNTKDGNLPVGWQANANTNDPKVIASWPDNANIGLSCQKSGLVPMDVDIKPGKVGAETEEWLQFEHGPLPATYTVRTGSGGLHYYFDATADVPARTARQNAFGPDVDLPPFVVIAGSVVNGKRYSVLIDAPVAPAPSWFQSYLKEPEKPQKNTEPSAPAVPLDVFRRMLAVTPYTGGPAGLDDRHSYQGCLNFLMAAHEAAGGESGDYLEAVTEWCLNDPNPDWSTPTSAEWVAAKWESFSDPNTRKGLSIERGSWFKLITAIGRADLIPQPSASDDFAGDPLDAVTINAAIVADMTARAKRKAINSDGLIVFGLDTVKARNVDFIWPGRLARGKHTALAGIGGIGKSQITIDMAARVSNGSAWPDIKEIKAAGWPKSLERAPQGYTIIMSAEDAPDDTILPRLIAAGGNPKFVQCLSMVKDADGKERKFNLQTDLERLKKYCLALGNVVLIVIDPASSYMGGDIDAAKNTKVRHVLDPITKLAEDLQCAIVSITHFRKGTSAKAVEKVMDSVAFVNAPRCALAVYEDPSDIGADFDAPGYVMLRLKSNLPGAPPVGLSYRIEGVEGGSDELTDYRDGSPIKTSRVVWQGKTDLTADQVAQMENDKGTPKLDEARKFLIGVLPEGEPKPVADVMAEAEAEGLAPDTVKRAKRALKVKAKKSGPEAGAPWVWYRGREIDLPEIE